jgi:iron-sulfur cluster assembly protein
MLIQLTEKAAGQVKQVQQDQQLGSEFFLRIGAISGGCSGFSYRLEFDKAFDSENDERFECHGVDLVVDKESGLLLDGTTIDWYEDNERQGFMFDNPNVGGNCGCGGSFEV